MSLKRVLFLAAGAFLLGSQGGGTMISIASLWGIADNAEWAYKLYLVISGELPHLSIVGRITMVAHAAYESGWGRVAKPAQYNNLWNLTAGNWWISQGRPTFVQANADLSFNASECAKKNRPMTMQSNGQMACRIDQVWRTYDSVNAAVKDYWEFLGPLQNGGRYVNARAELEQGDPVGFSKALYAAGYYTLPESQYTNNLVAIVNKVRGFIVGFGVQL